MLYVLLFIAIIIIFIAMSIFFKPIGKLSIKLFNYLKNIFMEDEVDGNEKV